MWYASKQKEHKILSSDLGTILAFSMFCYKVENFIGSKGGNHPQEENRVLCSTDLGT